MLDGLPFIEKKSDRRKRRKGAYLAAVLEAEPEGKVATALGVLRVGEDDGALGSPVEARADAADGGPEDDEPSTGNSLLAVRHLL